MLFFLQLCLFDIHSYFLCPDTQLHTLRVLARLIFFCMALQKIYSERNGEKDKDEKISLEKEDNARKE